MTSYTAEAAKELLDFTCCFFPLRLHWPGLTVAFRSLMKANVLTLYKLKVWEKSQTFPYVSDWTNAVRCSWKSNLLSTFLSEATLSLFWVKFATVLLGKNQFAIPLPGSADFTDKVREAALQTTERRERRKWRRENEGPFFAKLWNKAVLLFCFLCHPSELLIACRIWGRLINCKRAQNGHGYCHLILNKWSII